MHIPRLPDRKGRKKHFSEEELAAARPYKRIRKKEKKRKKKEEEEDTEETEEEVKEADTEEEGVTEAAEGTSDNTNRSLSKLIESLWSNPNLLNAVEDDLEATAAPDLDTA